MVGGTAWASLVPGLQRALGDQEPQVDQDHDDIDGVYDDHDDDVYDNHDDEKKDQGPRPSSWL